ncbi:MAG: hypothetical protein R2911_30000 [Caldilineaceae bacterium]
MAAHCHDRVGDSPYLEETYYYRIQPENGQPSTQLPPRHRLR